MNDLVPIKEMVPKDGGELQMVQWGHQGWALWQQKKEYYIQFFAVMVTASGDHGPMHNKDSPEDRLDVRIKWDGCSHTYFGDGDNAGYMHLCGEECWRGTVNLLAYLWNTACEYFENDMVNSKKKLPIEAQSRPFWWEK